MPDDQWEIVAANKLVAGDVVRVNDREHIFRETKMGHHKDAIVVRLRHREPLYLRWDAKLERKVRPAAGQ